MPDADPVLVDLVRRGREQRNLEYKGSSVGEPFAWGTDPVNSRITRTIMAMANIGGGSIVIGVDEVSPGVWVPNGVDESVAASYRQDDVQVYVNGRADPYVELSVRRVDWERRRFVVIQVNGFIELPVVCTRNAGSLKEGAVYTRPYAKHETAEIRTQSEMREILDRAIEVGVQKRLRPIVEALRDTLNVRLDVSDEQRFDAQREGL